MLGKIKNIGAMLIGLLIAVLILELFLRVYNPFPFRVRSNKIVLPVNQETISTNAEDTVVVASNSLGFRGADPPQDIHTSLSIIVVGGSTSLCIRLTEEDTWSALLDNKLKTAFNDVWLNNAGLAGHSTFGHEILLKDYVLQIHPKFVLFLVGINDVGRNGLHEFDQSIFKIKSTNPIMLLLEKSEIFYTLKSFARVQMAKKFNLLQSDFDLESMERATNSPDEIELLLQHHHDNYIPEYRKRIEGLVGQCQEAGVTPILITQPMLFGDTIDIETGIDLRNLKIFDAGKDNERLESFMIDNKNVDVSSQAYWKLLQAYNQELIGVGRTMGVHVIDLGEKMPKNSTYYLDSIHFSKKGAIKVADIIFLDLRGHLKEQGY